MQAALDQVDSELGGHLGATSRRHKAADVDSVAHGFVGATNLQAALNELIDDLGAVAAADSGAAKIGADPTPGTPNALQAGTAKTQLAALLGFINNHQGAVTGAHNASAIAAAIHSFLTGTNVQSQLQELASALTRTTDPSGASRIGLADADGHFTATEVESAMAELAAAFGGDHCEGSDPNAGQHRTIHQPVISGGLALLWDSLGTGNASTRFRVFSDGDSIWFTMNAYWGWTSWMRDSDADSSAGFRFSKSEFEVFHDSTGGSAFGSWGKTWRLPLSSAMCTAFELSGAMQETGRVSLGWTNNGTYAQNVLAAAAVTFRNRFETAPSSVTLTTDEVIGPAVTPQVSSITRDGFGYHCYNGLNGGQYALWTGTYIATV